MVLLKSSILRVTWGFRYWVRNSSTSTKTNFAEFEYTPKYNQAEQQKILTIVNEYSKDQLVGLNISQTNAKSLETYKSKRGPFKSLNEILEVDGLSVKMLDKLCNHIMSDTHQPGQLAKKSSGVKKLKQLLLPPLTSDIEISSVVGIHLAPIGVSWAKLLNIDNRLNNWGFQDLTNLPKKVVPTDIFRTAVDILNQLPSADVYVFEGTTNMNMQGQKQPSTLTSYNQQLELSSMLLALINTSNTHNSNNTENKVYFLRSKVSARLFKILVGNECVSSTAIINQLLDNSSDDFPFPCSPLQVHQKLKNEYWSKASSHKELLGQALMLTIAFTELCLKKNPSSINGLIPVRK